MASNITEQIKERLTIVDVVSSYVKLEKAGKNFKAKSPFGNEKTASFYVSPDRGMYYCFSTNQGGDIFTFVQKMEGVDFRGALKMLAERAGVVLTEYRKEDIDERERLFNLLEDATRFFEEELKKSPEAQAYIVERGIQQKTSSLWRIGYAPPSWNVLRDHLLSKGFTDKEMEAAGLTKRSEKGGGYYARFRGRIMFPVSDTSGRVIAYSGRILPLASNAEYKPDAAKYINSPETALYSKSHVLYGYDLAKQSIRKWNCSILVEGQMDVVLSHQAGYTNTIAVSGTALTVEQLSLLARLSNNVVMAFDADRAGIISGGKGTMLALARGMDVKVVALPKGDDPADLVRRSPELWRAAVRSAKHVVDFFLDYLSAEYSDSRKLRLAVGEIVLPYVLQIPNKIDQAHFVARIAERLRIQEEPIWEEVKKRGRSASAGFVSGAAPVVARIPRTRLMRRETIEQHLARIIFWQQKLPEEERLLKVNSVESRFKEAVGEERYATLQEIMGSEENKVFFEVEMLYDGTQSLTNDVEELLSNLEREFLRESYGKALEELRKAEVAQDVEGVARWLKECRILGNKLGSRGSPPAEIT